MTTIRSAAQEASEDLFFGQVVIFWARWFLVVGTAIVALWTANSSSELSGRIVLPIVLMAVNLFMHGRYLVERPANQSLLLIGSLVDVAAVTAIVGFWGNVGLNSPYFVFYYPILFAFALVCPPTLTAGYSAVVLVVYTVTCLAVDIHGVETTGDLKQLAMRLITLAAVSGLGAHYWRTQRERRRKVSSARPLVSDLATR